jgi:alpha,alpha-trehalase
LKITKQELKLWDRVSRKMYVPISKGGIISQFEGYDELEDCISDTTGNIDLEQLQSMLEQNGLVLNKYKISKQADVLMLFYVFSADELKDLFKRLGYRFDYNMIPRNIEYYLPRTANTSTLSRVAHTWVLSRLNRYESWKLINKMYKDPSQRPWKYRKDVPKSWDIFLEALGSDYFDIQGGTTREGIHMAAMAGTLDIIQRCYMGLVTRKDILWLSPQLPDALTRLSFTLHYRGQALAFEITHDFMKITAKQSSAQPIKIGFHNRKYILSAGETRTFRLTKKRERVRAA